MSRLLKIIENELIHGPFMCDIKKPKTKDNHHVLLKSLLTNSLERSENINEWINDRDIMPVDWVNDVYDNTLFKNRVAHACIGELRQLTQLKGATLGAFIKKRIVKRLCIWLDHNVFSMFISYIH